MNPVETMWLVIILSFLAAIASGGLYFRVAHKLPIRDRYPGNLIAAGSVVALLSGILVLMLLPLAIPTPGAQGTVQYWAGTPGMLMFFLRTLAFLFLIFIATPLVFAWQIYIVVLTLRKEFAMLKMLTVPVLLYVATLAAWIAINPQFAPMV